MPVAPRIVLLHATPVAVDPVKAAFAELWPEPELVNLLDDSLSPDRARNPDLSQELIDRFISFGRYAALIGADAILVTCSAFGPAIDIMAREFAIPVLKPNEAMFHAAVAQGRRIGMIATFAPAVTTMRDEFEDHVARTGTSATLKTLVIEEAMTALRGGDAEAHNRHIAERVAELGDVDTIMLAHFSTSRAAAAVRQRVTIPVLSAPGAAVSRLRALIAG